MKIVEYDLIDDLTINNSLVDAIEESIAEGWQPFGGPFSHRDMKIQAMVRYEQQESNPESISLNNNSIVYGKDKNNESSLEGMIYDKLLKHTKILEETIIALIDKYAKYSHGHGYWIETDYDEYYSKSDNHEDYATEILESIIAHRTRLNENENNNNDKCK